MYSWLGQDDEEAANSRRSFDSTARKSDAADFPDIQDIDDAGGDRHLLSVHF